MAPLRIEEIGTFDRLRAIRPAWERLWRRALDATPFSSPAWLIPWCEHLATTAPWSLAAWRNGELAALAPTFVYRDAGGRVLGLLGGGVSDYQDLLAEDDAAAEAVVHHLAARSDRFDVADLRALPRWSRLRRAATWSRVRPRITSDATVRVLRLPATFEALAPSASRGLLRDVQYQRRRLARSEGLDVRRVSNDEALRRELDVLFRLHTARWAARGAPGAFASPAVRRFHEAAAPALLEGGLLRLLTLRASDEPIAASCGLHAHGRSFLYLFGIDPGHARRSPGSLVIAQAVEDAIAERSISFDFLRGDEPYKARWGAASRVTLRVQLRPAAQVGIRARGRPRGRRRVVDLRAWPPRSS